MEIAEVLAQIDSCTECDACLDVCQTYEVTQNEAFSPLGRLKTAKDIFQGNETNSEAIDGIYNCLKCARCHVVCPEYIDIVGVVREAQIELIGQEIGPLERENQIIEGIQKLGNSVNGDPAKRWDWLRGEFPERESDTLLYMGCVACFLAPQAAISSYLLLKKLGVDFMMLKDEGCCGYRFFHIGKLGLAKEHFQKTAEKFKRAGIKRIITVCAGCYHNFKYWYREMLGHEDFEVIHISQLLPNLLRERKEALKRDGREMTYHDPCGLGRMGGIYDEPREALRLCGVNLSEMRQNRELGYCCAALNIANFRDIAVKIVGELLDEVNTPTLVTSCSFCTFALNYGARKTGRDKTLLYLSEVILDSLEHS